MDIDLHINISFLDVSGAARPAARVDPSCRPGILDLGVACAAHALCLSDHVQTVHACVIRGSFQSIPLVNWDLLLLLF